VKATTAPGSAKDKIIVNIEVTERPTGLFSIGGGYSSSDSFIATLDLSQRNFLGRGWELFFRARAGAQTQQGTIGFTEPWLFDRPLSAGFDLFNNRRISPTTPSIPWAATCALAIPSATTPAGTSSTGSPRTTSATWPPMPAPASRARKGSASPPSWAPPSPGTRGQRLRAHPRLPRLRRGDVAGVGFGDSKFVRGLVNIASFYNIWLDHVISGRAQGAYMVGWSKDPVPLFERFYLGGSNSLRGFKARQVSPATSRDPGRGTIQLLGNVEYTVPLFFGIRAAVFYDIGQVYGPDTASGPRSTSVSSGTTPGSACDGLRRSDHCVSITASSSTAARTRASGSSSSRWAPRSRTLASRRRRYESCVSS